MIVDRTLDIVRAAIANRHDLGGEMKMDETATIASFLQLKNSSRPVSTGQKASVSGDNAMEVQGEGEVVLGARIDGDGDDEVEGRESDARRNRRRREDDEAAQADDSNQMQEVKDATAALLLLISSYTLCHAQHHPTIAILCIPSRQ